MRRDQLEHLIRASTAILAEEAVIIVGSQSILGAVDDPPPSALMSMEAALLPIDDPDGAKADLIDGTIGEGSPFQDLHGIYGQGVSACTSILPTGWRERLIPIRNDNTRGATGWCLDPCDLAVAKLVAGREKDETFLRALFEAGLLDATLVAARLELTEVDERRRDAARARLGRWSTDGADPPG